MHINLLLLLKQFMNGRAHQVCSAIQDANNVAQIGRNTTGCRCGHTSICYRAELLLKQSMNGTHLMSTIPHFM